MTTIRDTRTAKRSGPGSTLLGSALSLALGLSLAGCGGGGGDGQNFSIVGVNMAPNFQGWQINRVIEIEFSHPVDFNSIDSNSINIRQVNGGPAMGEAFLLDPYTVAWQPRCPTLDDFSDAGLKSGFNGGVPFQYELNIIGANKNSQFPVRSKAGRALQQSEKRLFTTPTAGPNEPDELFIDYVVGPPTPVVRPVGSTETNATYLEVGGVGGTRHYFERPVLGGGVTLNPPLSVPLNYLGDTATQVSLVLQLNQSVDPRSSNIQSTRLPWEFQDDQGAWNPLVTDVTLESNCTTAGSTVRITPRGLMPPLTNLRAVITEEFKDLRGDSSLLPANLFAPSTTASAPSPLADNYLEEFVTDDNDDAAAPFAEPHAVWGGGGLEAAFSFAGTGGIDGTFDWKVRTGELKIFNSVTETIAGGPGFVAQNNQSVIGGVIDVRNLHIEPGGTLHFVGPNPITILASGDILIEGNVEIAGNNNVGVVSLNTTNIAEPGAQGQCGGGDGGTGSPLTTASSPKGGNGFGAFGVTDAGGRGGETCWTITPQTNQRRGAGGGGGRFGLDVPLAGGQPGELDQNKIGLDGEPGFDNLDSGTSGATSGTGVCLGGAVGPAPFFDGDPTNDFFGTMFVSGGGVVADQLIFGELKEPWAGAGGGGGGDANRPKKPDTTYPGKWSIAGDEKGAGGGGGGGSLQMLALGDITFQGAGKVFCRGGTGGGGENTLFLNRVGGGSGGGSGGHVILQAGGVIDFSGLDINGATNVANVGILATGGQGGAGKDDKGGASLSGGGIIKETAAKNDACPELPVPQQNCRGHIDGAGGDGSPGIVQLHTATGTVGDGTMGESIIVAPGFTLADYCLPPPLCQTGAGPNQGDCYMVPTFGSLSRARSDWIALGEGGFDVNNPVYRQIAFEFEGIDSMTGLVDVDANGFVQPQTAILTWANQVPAPSGYTFVQDASSLVGGADQVYLDNPELLRYFLLELREAGSMTNFQRFSIVSASYDSLTGLLTMNVDANGPALDSFAVGAGGMVDVQLQKAFFRITTNGIADYLPPEAQVQIAFEATNAGAFGGPETNPITVPLTSDITNLNFANNEDLRFIRFEVLFDISVMGQSTGLSPNSPIPVVEHLRMPFQYP